MLRNDRERLTVALGLAVLVLPLEVLGELAGVNPLFGARLDVTLVPSLIALFLLGYGWSLLVAALSVLWVLLVEPHSWLSALIRLAPALVFPSLAAFALLRISGRRDGGPIPSLFFGGFAILFGLVLYLAVYPPPSSAAAQPQALAPGQTALVKADAGTLLLGLLPLALTLAFALAVLVGWRRKKPAALEFFSNPSIVGEVAFAALIIRGTTQAITAYYLLAPLLLLTPESAMALAPPLQLFLWGALQAAIETVLAWLAVFALLKRA